MTGTTHDDTNTSTPALPVFEEELPPVQSSFGRAVCLYGGIMLLLGLLTYLASGCQAVALR